MSQPKLSVPQTPHMAGLLSDPTSCKVIARAFPALNAIISQTIIDVVNEDNKHAIGGTVLGIKNLQDILLLFKAKGDVLISQENK